MTTPDPGTSDAHDAEPAKPDLRKNTDSEPPAGGSPDSQKADSADTTPDFGRPFDYDATAQASLSAQPPTSESLGGSHGTPGPGWDTYSGVGNGPGWGTTPSYPPPSENPQSDYPPPGAYSYGEQTPPYQGEPPYQGMPGPVYGRPDPGYPAGDSSGYAAHEQAYPGYAPPPPGYTPAPGMPAAAYGYYDPSAPYGRDPYTGEPYSDKSKVTAGILGILLGPFGAGRFYLDQPGLAIAQIAATWLTCGIGGIWPLIDGILMLTGKVRDNHGRPLHP
ncbi:NINE protein [Rhodococcus chondri]|uniref:NINE protein n=1 Tax=Rhodococcus chondri TaxID=3065941 RepID=A0ABU7JUV9_9NOCA|nr:NINE protein [Rhodococcus sp. CC-R104]MEE2033808.1 NINE protein [Rhodococcus sp. CC-R104]